MAKLVLACRGEGHWSSREEDGAKIDLILSCEHPWHLGERLIVLSQIKSGSSFGELTEKGFKLKGSAKKAALRTSHGVCVVWVDRNCGHLYWAYVKPTASTGTQVYGEHHKVTPAMLYDLARIMSTRLMGPEGAKGIIINESEKSLSDRRSEAKSIYQGYQKIQSPVLGEVELTRLAWRHMFRSGRRKQNKSVSLDIIKYLGKLLSRYPTTRVITASRYFCKGGYEYRVCEHLLKFDELSVIQKDRIPKRDHTAYIRIIEEIRYPIDWSSKVMRSQVVSRRLVLKSAYFKQK
ncbi:hypothetical protein [Marinobacter sp. HL-58]|uniref:hypothetical protein n=1 Tax=Marinobacter sp. HL-58 TaxID=1479237 RepID=UPI0006DB6378|nr:hypothetical protein [Marinobacter sp. HL-58]KPQ01694.1 MAG: hypothetical protein HLUCCO03_11525 [Marinobacter sp. HL-58]